MNKRRDESWNDFIDRRDGFRAVTRRYEIVYRAGEYVVRREYPSFIEALLEAKENATEGWVIKAGPRPVEREVERV